MDQVTQSHLILMDFVTIKKNWLNDEQKRKINGKWNSRARTTRENLSVDHEDKTDSYNIYWIRNKKKY